MKVRKSIRASPEDTISNIYYEADNKIKLAIKKTYKNVKDLNKHVNFNLDNIFNNLNKSNKEYSQTLPQGIQNQTYFTLSSHLKHADEDIRSRISKTINKFKGQYTNLIKIKEAIEKDFKTKGITNITYSNGAKHSLSDYVFMSTRSLRCETDNIQNIRNARNLGTDYVYLSPATGHCPICGSLGDRVYCISGKDSNYPKVYGDLFSGSYHTIHPNCRCKVEPYFLDFKTEQEKKRDKTQSNRPFDPSVVDNKKYQEIQSLGRRMVQEAQEYHLLKNMLGEDFTYKNLSSFRRGKRSQSNTYLNLKHIARQINSTNYYKIKEYTSTKEIRNNFKYQDNAIFTKKEKITLKSYAGAGFSKLNRMLRNNEKLDNDLEQLKNKLSKAINKSKIKENLVAFRGTSLKSFNEYELLKNLPVQSWKGIRINDNAFMSTSLLKDLALNNNVIVRIHIPQGAKGVYLDKELSNSAHEHEILLQKNSKFKIITAYEQDNKIYMELELINNKNKKE